MMTDEYVKSLYGKYEKKVAKKRRTELKSALISGCNDKFEAVNSLKMKELHPLRKTKGIIGFVSTFLGCLFLVMNLFVYSYGVPLYNNHGNIAGKVGTDFKDYAAKANSELETVVNCAVESGILSAYTEQADKAQAYLYQLDNHSYRSIADLQNKIDEVETAYSGYQTSFAAYQEKYDAKITAAYNFEVAKVQYAKEKETYDTVLSEYNEALLDFATEVKSGASDGIPEIVYADLKAKYDKAVVACDAEKAKYAEDELTQLKTEYETALTACNEAKEQRTQAQEQLAVAKEKNAADDAEVISTQAQLTAAKEAYNAQVDIGTYDISAYVKAVEDAQTAYDSALKNAQSVIDNEIQTAQTALDNAEKTLKDAELALKEAKAKISKVLAAEEAVAAAEEKVNKAKENFLSLSELEQAELIYEKSDKASKAELTAKKTKLAKAEAAVLPLTNAEKGSISANEQFDIEQTNLTETQRKLITDSDEIINLKKESFSTSDLFGKISSNYITTVESYLKLTEEKNDAKIVIDRFLEKNLSAFDTIISLLSEFVSYGYSLDMLEYDVENYTSSSYDKLSDVIETALSDFKAKYSVFSEAKASYSQVYLDFADGYKMLWDAYSKAKKVYEADQSDVNKAAADSAQSRLELAKKAYSGSLIQSVNGIVMARAEANAYLNKLMRYISVYQRIATEAKPVLNDVYVYTCELTGNYENEETINAVVDGKIYLNYILADESSLNAVLGNYNLPSRVESAEKFFANAEDCADYIKGMDFDNFTECDGLTDGNLSELDGAVEKVNSVFGSFDAVTNQLSSDSSSLFADSQSCKMSADIISLILMVYNIIMAVVLFGYGLYILLEYRRKAMEENYNNIINSIND